MNRWPIFIFCIAAAVMTSCSPPVVERAEIEIPATPTPAPTPHPAFAARERAVQLYPELGVKDSLFHRTFMELFEQAKERDQYTLSNLDWPISLAHRAGSMLGVHPARELPATPVPTPATPRVIYVTPKLGNSLERGAYDQRRGVTQTPIYR